MAKAQVGASANLAAALAFKIEEGVELPAKERGFKEGKSSPYADNMKAMLVTDKIQSFFIDAESGVPASITTPDERGKAAKDEARKISNRVSGLARRLQKADASKAYTLRVRTENGKLGVRVYCIKPEAVATAA
jgi:hypothetical protein